MSDLTLTEQKHVRTAMRYLRRKMGTQVALADALHFSAGTVKNVMDGTNGVSASMALRVSRLADVSVDDLLAGRYVPGACPRCGYAPDFVDESTAVEAASRMGNGIKLVK